MCNSDAINSFPQRNYAGNLSFDKSVKSFCYEMLQVDKHKVKSMDSWSDETTRLLLPS